MEKIKNLLGFLLLVPIREALGRHDYCYPRNAMHLRMKKEFDLGNFLSGL